MKKTISGAAVALGLMLGLFAAPLATWAQSVMSAVFPVATTFTSSAPNGVTAFRCVTNGCQWDLGAGASDYLSSNGTNISTPTALVALGFYANGTNPYVHWAVGATIGTCSSANEGRVYRLTGTGGTNTGSQTRFCACVSDGAASPTYSWRNLISGTAGNSTTCNP